MYVKTSYATGNKLEFVFEQHFSVFFFVSLETLIHQRVNSLDRGISVSKSALTRQGTRSKLMFYTICTNHHLAVCSISRSVCPVTRSSTSPTVQVNSRQSIALSGTSCTMTRRGDARLLNIDWVPSEEGKLSHRGH